MRLALGELESPLGPLRFARDDAGRLVALAFAEMWPSLERTLARRLARPTLRAASGPGELGARLADYFAGDLASLDAIGIELVGTTFQRRVWSALREIPAGRTISYAALARALGAPTAVRAVGAANGANPIWLVVPCHRAIGSDGRLVGYAGGIERKRWLLAHESRAAQRAVQNSEKRPHSSGPSGAVPAFVPAGTATGFPPSKRWSTTPS